MVHLIIELVYVHWLDTHAFTGAVNAPYSASVTQVAQQHITMTGKTWGLAVLGSIVLHYSTFITHMPANRPRR
jgi:hypothetical protein